MFDSKNQSEAQKMDGMGGMTSAKPKKEISFKVHAMPQKFHSHKGPTGQFDQPTGKKSSTGKIVMIIVIVIVVLGMGVAGYLLLSSNKTNSNDNANANANQNANLTLNIFGNRNANTNGNANGNTNVALNANIGNSNRNISINTNTNTNSNRTLSSLALTQDLDADKLTDIEEDDYGTGKTTRDTDDDTFDDATELIFGYSPLDRGELAGSESVDQYTNTTFGFSVLYPQGWSVQPRGTDGRGVLFFPSLSSGEFIEISVQDNFGRLTPQQWYGAQGGNSNQSTTSVSNWSEEQTAVVSPDGFSVFYGSGNYILSMYYETNNQDEISYQTTFAMLQRSIEFLTPIPTTNANGNSNTNTQNQNTNVDVTTNTP